MTYREQLLNFILNDTPGEDVMNWIQEQPLLEQTDIMRELKKLGEELADPSEEGVSEKLEKFDEKINVYEDAILEQKLLNVKLEMLSDQQEQVMDRLLKRIDKMREYIVHRILTNAPDADKMRELAQQMIDIEKETGFYNPENWMGVE
jgi:GTPase involved in cell partitioning and DNA repair